MTLKIKEVPSRDSIIKNILTSTDAGLDYLAMIVCKVLGFSYKEVKQKKIIIYAN